MISFKNMYFWRSFSYSHPTIHHSNIGVHLRLDLELGTSTLWYIWVFCPSFIFIIILKSEFLFAFYNRMEKPGKVHIQFKIEGIFTPHATKSNVNRPCSRDPLNKMCCVNNVMFIRRKERNRKIDESNITTCILWCWFIFEFVCICV